MSNVIRRVINTKKNSKRLQNAIYHIKQINKILSENNIPHETSLEEYTELTRQKKEKPTPPSFPFIMLFLAIIMDLLDAIKAVTSPTIITIILIIFLIEIPWFILFFIWNYNKLKWSGLKGRLVKFLYKNIIIGQIPKFIAIFGLEMIPIFDVFVPGTIILVLWAHYDHTKAGRIADEIFEIINIYYKPKIKTF